MRNTRFLTRTILLLSFISLFTDVASEMLYPVMPVFLQSIGFSVFFIGLLEGFAEAIVGISKGYFGHLSDSLQKRAVFVQAGYGLSAIAKPLMIAWLTPLWVFFMRTLDRFGKGIRTSARDAILSKEATPQTKGKVFGFHRSMDTLGAAIGPVIALIYLYFYPNQYQTLFILAVFPGIFAIILSLLLKDKKSLSQNNPILKQYGFFTYFKYWKIADKRYKQLIIGLLIFAFFNSSDAFLLLAVKHKGFSDTEMIAVYIFYNLIYALFAYPAGIIADKLGLHNIMIFGFACFVLTYIGMPFSHSILHIVILFGIYGIYASATEGISKAIITNNCNNNDTATALGFYASFSSLMTMFSSITAGLIWFTLGIEAMFIFAGTGVLGVIVYFLLVFKKNKLILNP